MVCIFHSFQGAIASHIDIVHYFTLIVWSLNILLLIFFIIELVLRQVKCSKLPHAYLMVILSMISSIISSTFFLFSQDHFFFNTKYAINTMCVFGPIIAISFRNIAKNFTWALYIIRGQMVMESMDKCSTKLAKKAPYMLITQCILVTTFILIFTETEYISSTNSCQVTFPLWLLICSILIGELFYGLGFMHIFYKAMTTSMDNVYNSLRKIDSDKIKRHIRHHIIIYCCQLITSLIFLSLLSLCICFNTLVFFEAELFISNLCLLLLFRKKNKVFSKLLCCLKQERNMQQHLHATGTNVNGKQSSLRTVRSQSTIAKHTTTASIDKYVSSNVDSDNFLSDNWKGNKTIHELKAALKLSQAAPNLNAKALEMLGISSGQNKIKNKVKFNISPLPEIEITDKTPDSAGEELSIEIIIETETKTETENKNDNTETKSNDDWMKTFGRSTRIFDGEQMDDINDELPASLNLHESKSLHNKINISNNGLHQLYNIETKSNPVWTLSNKKEKDLQTSPSVHLLENDNFDFVETPVSPTSMSSFTDKLKDLINRMSNKRRQSHSESNMDDNDDVMVIDEHMQCGDNNLNDKYIKPTLDNIASYKIADKQLNELVDDVQPDVVNTNVDKLATMYSASDPFSH